ncbi:hypothetical protein B0H11DRAFT_1863438 [Mycena galericulata]|nr:hypothetical protein B0H11DRAFT_1863438 [Mycena galericulata]
MSLSAASHASTSALSVAARETGTSPASPFAQLLRNSRFATYDPQIRKTYYSPKQFVERGYWGLKRPITQRKKNSFVTIKQWEARQHYVEWDNAEDQVRFIRRIEELDARPGALGDSPWSRTLGPARDNWLVDSEFCPHEWEAPAKAEVKDGAVEASPLPDIPLSSLGNKGQGRYGKEGLRRAPEAVIPNIESMSPSEFRRYIAKLRALRPAFKAYIKREEERQEKLLAEAKAKDDKTAAVLLEDPLKNKSLCELAQFPGAVYHRRFLAQHTAEEYKTTNKIQPQPHRNGALMYAHPTMLDTFFHTKRKPGIVLQTESSTGRFAQQRPNPVTPSWSDSEGAQYIAAFAGIAATLSRPQAEGRQPLMRPGVDREHWAQAVTLMRPVLLSPLMLHRVPRVVGPDAEGLDGVRVSLRVTARMTLEDPRQQNPYFPGSRQYNAVGVLEEQRPGARRAVTGTGTGTGTGGSGSPASAGATGVYTAALGAGATGVYTTGTLTNSPKRLPDPPGYRSPFDERSTSSLHNTYQTEEEKAGNTKTLNLLQNLLSSNKPGAAPQNNVPDEDL